MRRRDFAGLLFGASAAGTMMPSSVGAQARTRRIGFLAPASAAVRLLHSLPLPPATSFGSRTA
jgi:hypothetical protein